ncbi:hypothetical protein AMK26_10380 [Streptomyces sp. CB03234]|uniref:hypothetical protein n=1 Tax=Streptomyces sp. (strain CB03234) TaxID=1703937 RepID=UPI000968C3B3|nr:hypothetical protein [Streptomyces sp. CB03234]OKK06423.1 hypothetical protein AMK26_10380 [Streptomyces sp. CB03234]
MGLRNVQAEVALPSAARGAGTYTSGPLAAAGTAADVLLSVHCTAASGTPTLDCSLEESADGSTWTAVPGSAAAQLAAVGNRVAGAGITKNYVRVTSTVGGTTPSMTYRVALWIRPE